MTDSNGLAGSLVAQRVFGRRGAVDHLQAPFLIRNASQIYLAGTLPSDAIASLLPSGMSAVPGNLCVAAFLDCPDGWEIAPFRGFYCGIVVEGHDAPDGTPGVFMVAGSYSGKAGTHLKSQVNSRFETAGASFSRIGLRANAGIDLANGRVEVAVTAHSDQTHFLSGTRLYLGLDPQQRLRVWTVAYSTPFYLVEVERLYLGLHDRLVGLRGFKVEWAALCFDKSMTFGVPRFAGAEAEAGRITAQTGLLDVFDRLGKPAAVVDGRGEVRFFNHEAERQSRAPTRLRGRSSHQQAVLERALSDAVERRGALASEVIGIGNGLAQIVPIDPTLAGEDAALAVFLDPAGLARNDSVPLLQLLGLTPAEARIAGAVGAGRSPREVAAEFDLTINTVRSALKLSFGKLGINRQSELARVVPPRRLKHRSSS